MLKCRGCLCCEGTVLLRNERGGVGLGFSVLFQMRSFLAACKLCSTIRCVCDCAISGVCSHVVLCGALH